MISSIRGTGAPCLLLAIAVFSVGRVATGMDFVRIAPDGKGFVLDPSGDRYVPWGHNYGSVDIMERLAKEPERVQREFAEMKAAGTTVARVHPEMPALLEGPDQANSAGLDRLRRLLAIAEKSGIYLQITGLACYKIKDRMAWYDALDDEARWKVQEFFWSTVGETFPLSCSAAEEREFLLKSRGLAHGWIGHWPDETPQHLAELKKQGKATIAQAIWLSWVELFRGIGPEMTK